MHLNICDSFNDENKRLTYQFINELIKKKTCAPFFHSIHVIWGCNSLWLLYCVCMYLLTMWFGEWNSRCMDVISFFNCVCEFINAHMLS